MKDAWRESFSLNLHLEITNYQFAIAFPHRSETRHSLESSERTVGRIEIVAVSCEDSTHPTGGSQSTRKECRRPGTPESTGPALLNPRVGTRESARVGGRHLDSPSTTVRLGHLAGIYNCLDSKSHRPFVLEFSLRPGSQCPPLRDLSSPSRTSPRPTGEIIPQPAEDGKRGLGLVPHFSGSRTRATTVGFAQNLD